MLFKQMQKADVHLPTGIGDESKHNINKTRFYVCLIFSYVTLTAFWLTYFLYIPLNIAYYSIKGRNTYPINMLHK